MVHLRTGQAATDQVAFWWRSRMNEEARRWRQMGFWTRPVVGSTCRISNNNLDIYSDSWRFWPSLSPQSAIRLSVGVLLVDTAVWLRWFAAVALFPVYVRADFTLSRARQTDKQTDSAAVGCGQITLWVHLDWLCRHYNISSVLLFWAAELWRIRRQLKCTHTTEVSSRFISRKWPRNTVLVQEIPFTHHERSKSSLAAYFCWFAATLAHTQNTCSVEEEEKKKKRNGFNRLSRPSDHWLDDEIGSLRLQWNTLGLIGPSKHQFIL